MRERERESKRESKREGESDRESERREREKEREITTKDDVMPECAVERYGCRNLSKELAAP